MPRKLRTPAQVWFDEAGALRPWMGLAPAENMWVCAARTLVLAPQEPWISPAYGCISFAKCDCAGTMFEVLRDGKRAHRLKPEFVTRPERDQMIEDFFTLRMD